jgi:Ca2+-binding RTX toxin-like protein
MANIIGTAGDDVLPGTPDSDLVEGLGGDDDLYGYEGDDTLLGGDGDDELYVMQVGDADRLDGGRGNDVLAWAPGFGSGPQVVVLGSGAAGPVQWTGVERLNFSGGYGADSAVGGGDADTLYGGEGDDTLRGGGGDDVLYGSAGDDRVFGDFGDDHAYVNDAEGADTLDGGSGIDTLHVQASGADQALVIAMSPAGSWGGVGFKDFERLDVWASALDDTIAGGAWADTLSGGDGDDSLSGEAGDDSLSGGWHDDTLRGGPGNDTLEGGTGADLLDGGDGDDRIIVYPDIGDIVVDGGAGIDLLQVMATSSGYTLTVLPDGSRLLADAGIDGLDDGSYSLRGVELIRFSDTLVVIGAGSKGDDTIDLRGPGGGSFEGRAGNDTYLVDDPLDEPVEAPGNGTDSVIATLGWTLGANLESLQLAGDAAIDGGGNARDNSLRGNAAANRLAGAAGVDALEGGGGADTLDGGDGADTLAGLGGRDTLRGQDGNDVLAGGAGADKLNGGAGADTFVFDAALASVDTLADFNPADDTIRLDATVFEALAPGALGGAQFLASDGTPVATTPDQHVLYDATSGALYYDADGNGALPAVRFALLGAKAHPVLDAPDFVIVA